MNKGLKKKMEWLVYVIALEVEVATLCREHRFPVADCKEQVVECVLDGETLEFCMGDYKQDFKKAQALDVDTSNFR